MSPRRDGTVRDHAGPPASRQPASRQPASGPPASGPPASDPPDPAVADLDALVGGDDAWLTVPDLVDVLDSDVSRVRRLLDDRLLVGVRRGHPKVLRVPRALADPEPLVSLPGTLTVLGDNGYTDVEALRWLFTHDEALGSTPVQALRSNRIAPVRRRAQVLLF